MSDPVTPKDALVLADRLQEAKGMVASFDELGVTLRTLADQNATLEGDQKALGKLLEAAASEADELADLATQFAGRLMRLSLALRNDGDARSALLKSQRG